MMASISSSGIGGRLCSLWRSVGLLVGRPLFLGASIGSNPIRRAFCGSRRIRGIRAWLSTAIQGLDGMPEMSVHTLGCLRTTAMQSSYQGWRCVG